MVVGQPNATAAFTQGEIPGTHFQRLSRPQGTWKKSPVTPPGIDPGTVRLPAQCLNEYATLGPLVKVSCNKPGQAQGVLGRLWPRFFLTFRHYKGGRSSATRTGRLYPSGNPWYSLSEAESTSGHMVPSGVPWKKSPVTPPGIDPGTVRLVTQHINHYATPSPKVDSCINVKLVTMCSIVHNGILAIRLCL